MQEEVYYREAMALGLDRDDTIIRRRLRQKMEFISDDVAAHVEPTDEELRAYLKEHPDAFRIEPRYTFTQVYLNPERHGEHLARDAAQLLARLKQAGASGRRLGARRCVPARAHAPRGAEQLRWRNSSGRQFAASSGRTGARAVAGTDRVGLRRASGVRHRAHDGRVPALGECAIAV